MFQHDNTDIKIRKKSSYYAPNQSQNAIMYACTKINSNINWKKKIVRKRDNICTYKHYKLAGKKTKSGVREVQIPNAKKWL